MAGQWVDIAAKDGGTFKGYLAIPASGTGSGILLLQGIFGVNKSMREVAECHASVERVDGSLVRERRPAARCRSNGRHPIQFV